MKTHEELVDEIYNNVSFRSEFVSYAKLWSTLKKEEQKDPAPPNIDLAAFVSYHDMTPSYKSEPDSPLIAKCKRGIAVLFSSLFRAISTVYQLSAEETRRLIFDVADRYSKHRNS